MEYLDKGYDYLNKYEDIYDNFTFENLMERMLERIDDKLDKREGSIIWDALAPAALELEALYIEEFLCNCCRQGMACREGKGKGHPPKGSKFISYKGKV